MKNAAYVCTNGCTGRNRPAPVSTACAGRQTRNHTNQSHTHQKSKKPILFRTVGVVCACACLAMGLFYLFPFYTRDLSANNVSSGSMQEVKLEPSAVEDHLSMPSAMTLSGISWHCTKRWAAAELPELGDYLDTGIIEPYNGASSAVSAEVYQIAQSTDSLQALESNSCPMQLLHIRRERTPGIALYRIPHAFVPWTLLRWHRNPINWKSAPFFWQTAIPYRHTPWIFPLV